MTFRPAAPMIQSMNSSKRWSLRRLSSSRLLRGGTAAGIILALFAFLHTCASTGGLEALPGTSSAEAFLPLATDGHGAEHADGVAASHHDGESADPASGHDDCSGECDGPSQSGCPHSSLCCLTWPPAVGRYVLPSPHMQASFDQVLQAVAAWIDHHLPAETSQFALIPSAAPPPLSTVAGPVSNRAPPSLA